MLNLDTCPSTTNDFVNYLLMKNGLSEGASLRDIIPLAQEISRGLIGRRDAACMVLGHHLTSQMVEANPDLAAAIMWAPNPDVFIQELLVIREGEGAHLGSVDLTVE